MTDYEAVKIPLDPTPAQERVFRMYAGAENQVPTIFGSSDGFDETPIKHSPY